MTGQPGYASGVVTNATHEQVMRQATAERRTLAALLTDAGYQTKAMGKMHFDPVRACYGFESMTLPIDYLRECEKRGTVRPKVHGAMECELVPALSTVDTKDSITTWIADGSIDFLETRDPLEQQDLAKLPAYADIRRELWEDLLIHTARTRPQALENGYFRTRPAPEFPRDVDFRWLGFHYKDYRFDVFH